LIKERSSLKRDGTEKYILRKAFDTLEDPIYQESFMEAKEQFPMEWDTIGLIN
jgi:hypothetical protein